MTREMRVALLGPSTSRRNKMALLARCLSEGEEVFWLWAGEPYRSRLRLSIDGGPLRECMSFDEDVHALMKDHGKP